MASELENYEIQLAQIESLLAIESNEELVQLKNDIQEAIEIMKSHANNESLNDQIDTELTTKAINIDHQNESSIEQNEDDQSIDYNQLINEIYLVPFIFNNKIEMHEAKILRIIEIDKEDGDAELEVKFLYPLNESMKYCSDCKNNLNNIDRICPFNHGYSVNLSMIKDPPSLDNLQIDSNCLFKEDKDEFWKKGKIVSLSNNSFVIKKEFTQDLIFINDHIRPFDGKNFREEELIVIEDESNSNDEVVFLEEIKNEKKYSCNEDKSTDPNQNLTGNNSNLKDSYEQSTSNQGLHETYSNSIGYKLLKKQGYEIGTGLGKNRDGIVDPISLTVNPKNASLDTVMELKNQGYLSTSADKFSFDKQKKYFKDLILKKNLKKLKNGQRNSSSKLFDTLNQNLATKSVPKESKSIYSKLKIIQNETKKADNLNLDIFNVEKEIKRLKEDILHVKKSISLCREMNPSNLKKLNNKLNLKESELHTNELRLKAFKEKKKRKEYDHNVKYFG